MPNNTDQARNLIIEYLNKQHQKTARFDKDRPVPRPVINGKQAILSWEIYHDKTNPDEHTTIKILNELVGEGKAIRLFNQGYYWYCLI